MSNTNEKSLISKIKKWIEKLFSKPKEVLPEAKKEVCYPNNNFRSSLQEKSNNEQVELLTLQNEYENGNIKEWDLSDEEKEKLKSLYKNQIEELKKTIENYKQKITKLKNKN